jgi:hypothetical protein
MEAKFKWQDACGAVSVILAVAAMTDMPIVLRLAGFTACAICLPISFFSHKNWLPLVRWLGSIVVVAVMAYVGWNAWNSSRPKKQVFIEWKQPTPMEFGTALSEHQLDAIAKSDGVIVPGKYNYNPTFGATLAAGMDTLSVEFTPSDLSKFSSEKETITVLVKDAPAKPLTIAPKLKDGTPAPKIHIKQDGHGNTANPGTILGPVHVDPCGVLQNGGSGNTANVQCPPPLKITASAQTQTNTGNLERPYATVFTIRTNIPAQIGDFRFTCTAPVISANIDRISNYEWVLGTVKTDPNDNHTVIYPVKPEPLDADRDITVHIFSAVPLHVVSGKAGVYPISFTPQ